MMEECLEHVGSEQALGVGRSCRARAHTQTHIHTFGGKDQDLSLN